MDVEELLKRACPILQSFIEDINIALIILSFCWSSLVPCRRRLTKKGTKVKCFQNNTRASEFGQLFKKIGAQNWCIGHFIQRFQHLMECTATLSPLVAEKTIEYECTEKSLWDILKPEKVMIGHCNYWRKDVVKKLLEEARTNPDLRKRKRQNTIAYPKRQKQ
jgi:hypothetical protein